MEGDKIKFEPGCIQPDPTNDLLEEMKSFNVADGSIVGKRKGNNYKQLMIYLYKTFTNK